MAYRPLAAICDFIAIIQLKTKVIFICAKIENSAKMSRA